MMTFYLISLPVVAAGALALSTGLAAAQTPAGTGSVLATVRIPQAVLANGQPLPAGSYELRLTADQPAPLPGQTAGAERWVEFVANGRVAGREVAQVLRDDDRPDIGASSVVAAPGVRVGLLKSGEFVRVSVKRAGERYLIYLPVSGDDRGAAPAC